MPCPCLETLSTLESYQCVLGVNQSVGHDLDGGASACIMRNWVGKYGKGDGGQGVVDIQRDGER